MMSILITADLHLTDKPRDSYRFGIFDFLIEQSYEYDPWGVLILGDLTDAKDRHSSKLVNNIVDNLERLAQVKPVYILMGNHDYYADIKNPFFRFINKIQNINFITKPIVHTNKGTTCLFLPHTNNPNTWKKLKKRVKTKIDYIFLHQAVDGAVSETGKRLSGANTKPLVALKPLNGIWAGDIHKPQQAGPVTYVGSPYNIKFGEDFTPRLVLLDDKEYKVNEYQELHFDCPRKYSLKIRKPEELKNKEFLKENDQVIITLELLREEVVDWVKYRNEVANICKDIGLEVYGTDFIVKESKIRSNKKLNLKTKKQNNIDIIKQFCKREKISSSVRKAGIAILEN